MGCTASARKRDSASPARSAREAGGILGEAQHPAPGGVGLKAKSVRHGGRNEDRGRRRERQPRRFERHLAAALLDQQDLKEVAMPVCAYGPVMDRRSRGNRFNVNEVERLIVRRIPVEVEQGERGGHAASIGRSRRRNIRRERATQALPTKRRQPAWRRLPLKDYGEASAVHAAAVLAALPGLVLAALLLAGLALSAALLLLTRLLATLLMLRLLVALLRIALLLLVTPRIVLLLVRHGTLSSDFVGLHRSLRPRP